MKGQSRAEQSRAEQNRAEQSRAEQNRAEQSRRLVYKFGQIGLLFDLLMFWTDHFVQLA